MKKVHKHTLKIRSVGINLAVALLQIVICIIKPDIWFALQGMGLLIGVYVVTTVIVEDNRPVWYPLWTYQFLLVWFISIISFMVVHIINPMISWIKFIISYYHD